MILTSMKNPHIQELQLLKERKERDEKALFLIEGYRETLRAMQGKVPLKSLYFCKEFFLGENEPILVEKMKQSGVVLYECSPYVFQKVSYRDRPDGLMAVAFQQRQGLHDLEKLLEKKKNPFLLVAECIEKPGNLGTILRSSDGAGVDSAIICDPCTDIFNPNAVRASIGTLFTQPIILTHAEELLSFLKKKKIAIVATSPHADKEFTQVDLTQPVAIAVGSEQYGLSEQWMQEASLRVRIPMLGIADSLNVATATTLLLYEVLRQRRSV